MKRLIMKTKGMFLSKLLEYVYVYGTGYLLNSKHAVHKHLIVGVDVHHKRSTPEFIIEFDNYKASDFGDFVIQHKYVSVKGCHERKTQYGEYSLECSEKVANDIKDALSKIASYGECGHSFVCRIMYNDKYIDSEQVEDEDEKSLLDVYEFLYDGDSSARIIECGIVDMFGEPDSGKTSEVEYYESRLSYNNFCHIINWSM